MEGNSEAEGPPRGHPEQSCGDWEEKQGGAEKRKIYEHVETHRAGEG